MMNPVIATIFTRHASRQCRVLASSSFGVQAQVQAPQSRNSRRAITTNSSIGYSNYSCCWKKDKDSSFFSPSVVVRSFSKTTSDDANNSEATVDTATDATTTTTTTTATTTTSTYDPYEITKSFEDTSYYYPPAEELDPKFLAAKYEGMTNEELLDTSTIVVQRQQQVDDDNNTDDINNFVDFDTIMHAPPIRDKNAALPKGTLVGKVVSTKMQKTINIAVDRYKIHKKYRKRIRYTRKFMAHDEHEVASMGDTVLIVPSQRISKQKHFVLREIIRAKGQL